VKASCDSKVRQFKSHKNSTGHATGRESGGCPEATTLCEGVCYVNETLRYPAVSPVLNANLEDLKACKTVKDFVDLYKPLVEHAEAQYRRALNRLTGKALKLLKKRGHIFRHGWSGDIISLDHAEALNIIAHLFPDTSFWLYTRTWWAMGKLTAPNLDAFLSVDAENSEQMKKVAKKYKHARLAFLTKKPLGLGVVCPATNGKLKTEGACNTCGLCYGGKDYAIEFIEH